MKQLFLIFFLISFYANAQYLEVAKEVLGQGSNKAIITELERLNAKLTALNKTSVANELNTLRQKEILSKAEDLLSKVDDYIKKGEEIKQIYKKEEEILLQLKEVQRLYSNGALSQIKGNASQVTRQVLSQTNQLLDLSSDIVSNSIFRMSSEERRNYLKEILADLTQTQSILNEQIYLGKQYMLHKEEQKRKQKDREDFEKELRQKREILNRM